MTPKETLNDTPKKRKMKAEMKPKWNRKETFNETLKEP